MYVILTSKPGQFRTETIGGLRPLEAYDYLFYGHAKARFVIAELLEERTKIRVIEDGTAIVNDVPSKFLSWLSMAERRAAAPRTRPDVAAPGPDGPA